jgi:hypothetical protein
MAAFCIRCGTKTYEKHPRPKDCIAALNQRIRELENDAYVVELMRDRIALDEQIRMALNDREAR